MPSRGRLSRPSPGLPPTEDQGAGAGESDDPPGASDGQRPEVLRHRDVASMSPAESTGSPPCSPPSPRRPRRCTARHQRWHRGARRCLADPPGQPARGWASRGHRVAPARNKPRRVVLLVDVSGSMSGYADALLRLAHRVSPHAGGPRCSRRHPAHPRHPGAAQPRPRAGPGGRRRDRARLVRRHPARRDVRAFLDRWGQRGMARGAVVVVFSDGWERATRGCSPSRWTGCAGSRTGWSG